MGSRPFTIKFWGAAHNLQIVLKDAFELNSQFTALLTKIQKIVAKYRTSTTVAEELRMFGKKVAKKT